MNEDPENEAPDPSQIGVMLSQFKPRPSKRFYEKVSKSPWMQATPVSQKLTKYRVNPGTRWLLVSIILALILLSLGVLFIQPIRVIAHQIIYSFINLPTEQINIQVEQQNPQDIFQESDPKYFLYTFQEVQNLAGFHTKELSDLPEGLILTGTRYDPQYGAVIALYEANEYKLFFTQRLLNNGKDVFTVGPSATVMPVDMGEQRGEYVAGGWKAIFSNGNSTIEDSHSINAIWDDNLPQYTLRWQQDDFSYEIRSLGVGSPSLSELIAMAIGIK